ncbi:XdhC/CoxI family protein [Clostridium sp. AM58-1XD]|uniref:XdhC family protein n=1 Tax=Clostridium sp. AM58-1XD TaxID=2292307 RepID=UPI0015F52E58|nr:XdhC/CoxI family protein [Clostridium sp. AM58-1XD]
MKTIFHDIKRLLKSGESLAVVTIVESAGSTPRGAGSRMAVRENGSVIGTVGGGEVEHRGILMALEVLKEKKSRCCFFRLNQEEADSLKMICGGSLTFWIHYLNGSQTDSYKQLERICEAANRREKCWLILEVEAGSEREWRLKALSEQELSEEEQDIKKACLTCREGKSILLVSEDKKKMVYCEYTSEDGKVYIFGAGHVAAELVPLLNRVGFCCTVFDDRPEFACRERFPEADEVITGDFENIRNQIRITEDDYICIMTRGHQYDYLVQKQVITSPARYIGVMGSSRKTAVIAEKLAADGFSDDQIKRFSTPIGLPIRAETPEEIAVSITGELILVRASSQQA